VLKINLIYWLVSYQLDLRTPGSIPELANSLKQMRHRLNLRIYPRLRPHFQQRRTDLELNLGFLLDLTICDWVAIKN